MGNHILLDVPAKHPTLGFTRIGTASASIIGNSEPRLAIRIFGGWGSGKSTLMEEIGRQVTTEWLGPRWQSSVYAIAS